MANNSIAGLELNIDHDFISETVRQVALAEIGAAMGGHQELLLAIVDRVMKQTVNDHGKEDRYSKQTILEYYVKKMLEDETKKQIADIVDSHRGEISDAIRRELESKSTLDKLVKAFSDSVTRCAEGSYWMPRVDIRFDVEE